VAIILVAEDEKNLRLLLEARLKPLYTVLCASDGLEALEIYDHEPIDLLITDILMPRLDGYELLKALRDRGSLIPVLMLTAKQTLADKREGFKLGADDYLVKPVQLEELLMRVQALLRRSKISSSKKIIVGSTVLDSERYTLSQAEQVLELPRLEFNLLFKLLSDPGRIFTKQQLLEEVWGNSFDSGEDTVKTHISRLRTHIKNCSEFKIVTLKGLGYKAEIH